MSVRTGPAICFHLWCSDRYQRISPLHLSFRWPLPASRCVVQQAIPRLSRGISQTAFTSACVRFKPSDSAQRSGPSYYRGCWHEVSRDFLSSLCQRTGRPVRFLTCDRSLRPEGLHPPRGVALSGFRPLQKILDCSLP